MEATQNGHVPWNEKLLVPFEENEIGIRPQVWCSDCRKAVLNGQKACLQGEGHRKHEAKKCPDCGQNITTAHLHLYYVGHADLTYRLLDADPRWKWEPLARDVDPEVLKAAIASGNPEIVKMVLEASPPKLEEFEVADRNGRTHIERGMWMRLILHDDDGQEVTMIGFGDAKGKDFYLAPGDTIKEIIGDGLRNSGMRRGAALALWRKQDREQARKERQEYDPDRNAKDRMAMFDDDAKDAPPIGSGQPPQPPPPPPHAEAQAAIELAWQIAQRNGDDPAADIAEVRAEVHDPANRKRHLGAKVHPPWSADPDERVILSAALTHVKNLLLARQEAAQEAQAGSGA